MSQADFVQEVFALPEFREWLPKERKYLELTHTATYVSGIAVAIGFAIIASVIWSFGYPIQRETFGILFLIGCLLYYGWLGMLYRPKTRILRFSRDEIEIGDTKTIMLKGPWEDIESVTPIGKLGFDVKAKSGSARLVWPIVVGIEPKYSQFIRDALTAMARGLPNSELRKYRLPTTLEPGKTYAYKNLPNSNRYAFMAVPLAAVMAILFVNGLLQKKWLESLNLLMAPTGLLVMYVSSQKQVKRARGTTILVEGESATIRLPGREVNVPLDEHTGTLAPSKYPSLFSGAERFGVGDNSEVIDRRFLVPMTSELGREAP